MKTYSIPRHIWRAVYPVLIFFALSIAVAVASTIVIVFAVMFTEGMNDSSAFSQSVMQSGSLAESIIGGGMFSGAANDMLSAMESAVGRNAMWAQLATSAVQIAVLLPLLHFTLLANPRFKNGKLSPSRTVLVVFAAMGLSLTMSFLIGMLDIDRFFPGYGDLMDMIAGASFISQLLAVGIVGPIAEEICFRGLVHTRLEEWLPGWAAALISGVLFGVIHLNILQGAYAFIFGVGLSFVYMKYKTVWAPIAAHIGFNIVSILLDGLIKATGWDIPTAAVLVPAVLVAAIGTFMIAASPTGEKRVGDAEIIQE